MVDAGILGPDDRVELIEGEIIEMSPIGPRHASIVNRLTGILATLFARKFVVSIQNPVVLNDYSVPQPDLAVLKWRDDYYAQELPAVQDTLIAIEVSDTTLEKDRGVKLPLYARTGIPEVWLIDLYNDRIEVHSALLNGVYQRSRIVQRDQDVQSDAIPQLTLTADEILG
ncbi:MAG: Uma2 family endonuclease [Blastocatellia bacterium]